MKHLLAILALTACSGTQPPPPASPAECARLERHYQIAYEAVIHSGACDHVERIEDCRPYFTVEELYVASMAVARCP